MQKNDFIIIRGTRCYFIDNIKFLIRTGIIVGYDNIKRTVTIKSKSFSNEYEVVYRNRDYIWFDLEKCLLWLTDYLRTKKTMGKFKVMDLSSQLDGINKTFNLSSKIKDNYTIYMNGLRQDRNDFIIDDNELKITLLFDYTPTTEDTLVIEYWEEEEIIYDISHN